MSGTTVQEMPPTPGGVIPYLTVSDGEAALAFYERAFGATDILKSKAQDGRRLMHARFRINNDTVMLSDDFPEYHDGKPSAPQPGVPRGIVLHVQVDDADAAWQRATEAGAVPVMALMDMFWGDRYGQLRDPFGHVWSIASRIKSG